MFHRKRGVDDPGPLRILDRQGTAHRHAHYGYHRTSECGGDRDAGPTDRFKHFDQFIENLRTRKRQTATVETLHQATAVGHLMNISWETGRSIRWDGDRHQVVGDPKANAMVMRPYRAPWKLEI